MDYVLVWPTRGLPLRRIDGRGWSGVPIVQTVLIVPIASNVNCCDYRKNGCLFRIMYLFEVIIY